MNFSLSLSRRRSALEWEVKLLLSNALANYNEDHDSSTVNNGRIVVKTLLKFIRLLNSYYCSFSVHLYVFLGLHRVTMSRSVTQGH